MAWTSGSATDYQDLLGLLRDYAVSEGWALNRDDTPGGEMEVMLQGDGGGSMQIYVGIRSFNDGGGSGAFNWELAGFSGFNTLSPWESQPGVSPGRWETPENGAYVPLRNASIDYWFFVSNRRIIVIAKMGTTYVNMYLGLINQYGTNTEYPYPLAVFGCSSLWNKLFSSSSGGFSGMVDPIRHNAGSPTQGPAFIRNVAGDWKPVINGQEVSGSRGESNDVICWPCGRVNISDFASEDRASNGNVDMADWIPTTGSPGTPTRRLLQTPTDQFMPIPPIIMMTDPNVALFGTLDNVAWVSSVGDPANLVSEDIVTIDGDDWIVFQNCNRTEIFNFFLVKKE